MISCLEFPQGSRDSQSEPQLSRMLKCEWNFVTEIPRGILITKTTGLLVEVPSQGQLPNLELAFIYHLACGGYHNKSDVPPASRGTGMKRTLNFGTSSYWI